MKKLYLIANNPQLSDKFFGRHYQEMKKGDVLHFNWLTHLKHFIVHPANIFFHNVNDKENSWWGSEQMPTYMTLYSVIDRYIYKWGNTDFWTNAGGKVIDYYSVAECQQYDDQNDKYCGSAGFLCWAYFREKYEKIVLVGFTFEGSSRHNWKYERKTLLSDPKVELIGCGFPVWFQRIKYRTLQRLGLS